VGRLERNQHRFVANAGDARALQQLSSSRNEPIGRVGWVTSGEDGRNLFVFDAGAKI